MTEPFNVDREFSGDSFNERHTSEDGGVSLASDDCFSKIAVTGECLHVERRLILEDPAATQLAQVDRIQDARQLGRRDGHDGGKVTGARSRRMHGRQVGVRELRSLSREEAQVMPSQSVMCFARR